MRLYIAFDFSAIAVCSFFLFFVFFVFVLEIMTKFHKAFYIKVYFMNYE